MASFLDKIQSRVKSIKETLLVQVIENPSSFVSCSAYDTAWLAMVGDPKENDEKPMFKTCLEWVLSNQNPEGFWGERDCHGNPTIDSLPSSLACMVASKMWDMGHEQIEKGMSFLVENSTSLLKRKDNICNNKHYPRWFAIVFPGMVEVARVRGFEVMFANNNEIKEALALAISQLQDILSKEDLVDKHHYPPLLSYLEVLPSPYYVDQATLVNNLSNDGSLFQSPAATAAAYMSTRNSKALSYLCNLVQNHSGGVPSMYPIDEDCIKLYMINHLQRLGLSDHFDDQIRVMSNEIYRQYNEQGVQSNIFKSSLAFKVLRLQGYKVSPRRFVGLLKGEYALQCIEENHDMFASAMYNLYRATDLMFDSEVELQELRSFSRRLLEKLMNSSNNKTIDDGVMMWPHLREVIKRELLVPSMARLDHLDHRDWIEANKESPLWLGKASFYRISCLENLDLRQLAKDDYEVRQMVYKKELLQLTRWSKDRGLVDMGFARDKTTYCYFAIASGTSFSYDTNLRLILAKMGVLITVIDDFFDMEGSLDELQILANAVQRWDNKGLRNQSKILFDALDNFVAETAKKYLVEHHFDITDNLRKIWYEVVASWLTEATWSKTGELPSMASYIETGMISVTAHLTVLQGSCFLTKSFNPHNLNPSHYETITRLLMTSCRLLNDLHSYEKELKEGKINAVLLHLNENPDATLDDAVDHMENILKGTKLRFLEHALIDGIDDNDFPRPCKMLHLTIFKVFQMFYNSANHFDSKDSLLDDINKAIFVPLEDHTSKSNLLRPYFGEPDWSGGAV